MKMILVILFIGTVAQAQQDMQQMIQKSWGAGSYSTNTQVQHQQEQQQNRQVRCFTRQVPGTGLFGSAPQFETVCK
jgi:hypothetical protein